MPGIATWRLKSRLKLSGQIRLLLFKKIVLIDLRNKKVVSYVRKRHSKVHKVVPKRDRRGIRVEDARWPIWYSRRTRLNRSYKGKALGIEVKRPGKKATRLQDLFLKKLQAAGAIAFIAYNLEDAKKNSISNDV